MSRTELYDRPPARFAWLAVVRGPFQGRDLRLQEQTDIGRSPRDPTRDALVLPDQAVSTEHARIKLEGQHFVLYDLGSLNGTMVNDVRVERCILVDGDRIRIGDHEIVFKCI